MQALRDGAAKDAIADRGKGRRGLGRYNAARFRDVRNGAADHDAEARLDELTAKLDGLLPAAHGHRYRVVWNASQTAFKPIRFWPNILPPNIWKTWWWYLRILAA